MRIVLDAKVLISALISVKGSPARLLAYWQEGKFDIVASPAMLQELERVLHYPRLQQQYHLPEEEIRQFLRLLMTRAIEVNPAEEIAVIDRDLSDKRYLQCALAGEAQYIISGDGLLLDLRVPRDKDSYPDRVRDFSEPAGRAVRNLIPPLLSRGGSTNHFV